MARNEQRNGGKGFGNVFEDIDLTEALRFAQQADETARAGGFHEEQVRTQKRNLALIQAEEQRTGISGFSARCTEFSENIDQEIRTRAAAMAEALHAGRPVPSGVIRVSYTFKPKNPLTKKGAFGDIKKTFKELMDGPPAEPSADLFNMLRGSLGMQRIQAALDHYSRNHTTRLSAQLSQGNKDPWTYYVSINIAQAPAALPAASYGPENRGDQFHGRAAFSAPNASVFGMFEAKDSLLGYTAERETPASDPLDKVFDTLNPHAREELLGLEARLDQARTERTLAEEALRIAELGTVHREINEARVHYGAARSAFDTAERAYKEKVAEVLRPIQHAEERARIQRALSGVSFDDKRAMEPGVNFQFGFNPLELDSEELSNVFRPNVKDTGFPAANENEGFRHAAE